MLADYPGTVLLVSHDRDFLDRVVTSTLASDGDGNWLEYAGGYSDMLAQRGPAALVAQRGPAALVAEDRPRPKTPSALPPRPPSRKLSFKDKQALETLPGRIEAIQAEIARLQSKLADPDLYRRNPASFAATSEALARAGQDLAVSEERWLELEMLREELEA